MSHLATRRLIDASATLADADRALLNLWVNRGLDDPALARMAGTSEEMIAERRDRIVDQLSGVLGLPPENLRTALAELAMPDANGAAPPAVVMPSANGAAPAEVAPPQAEPAEPDTASSPPRRRWRWPALALLVIAVAIVVVVSLGSSGAGHHRRPAPASTQTAAPTSAANDSPVPTGSRPSREPLLPFPGAVHASGSVHLNGTGPHPRLNLSVSHLPATSHGHYEVWLYDSLLYAEPLGRLPAGGSHVSFQLPGNAARYRSIDISLQPPGLVFNSGESMLRSLNPLFTKSTAARP